MYLINNNNINDPAINLALEEYCLRNMQAGQDYLLFYNNAPSVIIGRNQNPMEEINYAYLKKKGIQLVRRISGGGAVYHDFGNINFCLITAHDKTKFHNYEKLTEPAIRTLKQMGIPAALKKNHIVVEGRKISGTAQFTNMHTIVSHGTLLFDADLDVLAQALESNTDVMASKAVKSVKSDVVNISEFLSRPMEMALFEKKLLESYSERYGALKEYQLSGQAWDLVYELSEKKYQSWEWNFGKTPEFIAQLKIKAASGDLILRLKVNQGIITEIETDQEGSIDGNIQSQANRLIGKPYDRKVSD
jgi:lipoate-protein ligase A